MPSLYSIPLYSIPVYCIVLYSTLFYNNLSCIIHLFEEQTILFYSILFSVLFCSVLFCSVLFYYVLFYFILWVVGSGDGAGWLPVPVRPTALAYSRVGACCACSRCGTWGGGGAFFSSRLSYLSFLMPHPLGDGLTY